jgi:hypothetical protein
MTTKAAAKTEARAAAIAANARVWALLERPNRSAAETAEMIAAAHESHERWLAAGGPVEEQRGNWLIARAYVDAGLAEPAADYAHRTLRLTDAHRDELADFDLAFAEEIAARACAAAGDRDAAAAHRAKARELGAAIADAGDRQEFFRQLSLPPWFGLAG